MHKTFNKNTYPSLQHKEKRLKSSLKQTSNINVPQTSKENKVVNQTIEDVDSKFNSASFYNEKS